MGDRGEEKEADQGYDPLVSLMFLTLLKCEMSYRRLYDLTHSRVLHAVLRVNRNRDDAAEILQDVYVTVWDRAAQYDPHKGSVMKWLSTIARRKAVDSLRHRSCRLRSTSDMAANDDDDLGQIAHAEHLEPFAALAAWRAAEALHRSLDALPPDHRSSVVMSFFEDMTHVEIAERMRKPLGTVKTWVRRSVQSMRPGLAGH